MQSKYVKEKYKLNYAIVYKDNYAKIERIEQGREPGRIHATVIQFYNNYMIYHYIIMHLCAVI